MSKTLLVLALLAAGSAFADDAVYQFRSVEDPSTPPDPAVCAAAPFRVNVLLGASLWSTRSRSHDGKVVNDDAHRVGTATACVLLTSFLFPPGLQQQFYVQFDLASGRYTALGTCTLVSNDVPKTGLVLAGCALKVIGAPSGVAGGVATSTSVFNPFRLEGFSTGSYWMLQVYPTAGAGDGRPHHGHDHDMVEHEDGRSDEEIAAHAARVHR
ncbi:MAG: hypothetical protein ACYC8T_02460 [Myxococcaceae bacterium]